MSTKLVVFFIGAFSVAQAQPPSTATATATPGTMTFAYQIGANLPLAQTVTVKGSAAISTYTSSITPPTALWLTSTPDIGKMPASLTVRVNPTSLSAGNYTAQLNVAVVGVATPVAVTVNLVVTAPLPMLSVTPMTLNLATASALVQATVTLSTTGTPVSFTASISGAPWLTMPAQDASGVVLPGGPVTITLTADPTTLPPTTKVYTGKLVIVANGVPAANKTQNVTINLSVSSSFPTITSLWPSTVQANTGAAPLTIRGTNFYAGTTVKAGATTLTPILLSSTLMQAVVPATLLTVPGTAFNVVVTNPPPGGGASLPAILSVSSSPVIQAVLNAASYAPGPLSPGEIIALFGLGIGPANPTYLSSAIKPGFVDTTVNGLTVMIGGLPAPLLYADPNQITVQVPYEVVPGPNQIITVTNGTSISSGPPVTIGALAPGIFTADGSGANLAAAIVYNGATGALTGLNSATVPAHSGDTIEIYLTGEGDYLTTPVAHTGYIIPATTTIALLPLYPAATLPTVTIGGVPASVSYAGPIPGCMIGLLQMNVVVPAGVAPGIAVPLIVTFGAVSSQVGVTIVIK